MVDAGDLSGLPPRLSPAARRELSLERLSSQTAQLHDTYGSARGVRELVAGHHATFAVVAERGEWQLFVALTDEGEIDELRAEPAVARSAPLGLPFTGEWRVSHGVPDKVAMGSGHGRTCMCRMVRRLARPGDVCRCSPMSGCSARVMTFRERQQCRHR